LIDYMLYIRLRVRGERVSSLIPFWRFLDILIKSTSIQFSGVTSPKLGYFGYVTTVLEILGFAAGSLAVYSFLRGLPYCDRCSWRMAFKGRQIRYTPGGRGMLAIAAVVADALREGAATRALEQHGSFGSSARYKDSRIRSVCDVHACSHCGRHMVRFYLEQPFRESWVSVAGSRIRGFMDTPDELPK